VCIIPSDASAQLHYRVRKYNADSTHDHIIADLGTPTAVVNTEVTVPDDIWGLEVANNDPSVSHGTAFHLVNQSEM
jgi:hypothetical protein